MSVPDILEVDEYRAQFFLLKFGISGIDGIDNRLEEMLQGIFLVYLYPQSNR